MKNVLEWLERTALRCPDKIAVDDGNVVLSFEELRDLARRMGSGLAKETPPGRPVAVYLSKSSLVLAAMMGVVYAGCFYVMIDPEQPKERVRRICDVLCPELVITDEYGEELFREIPGKIPTVRIVDLMRTPADLTRLKAIRKESRREDLLYGIFTSGSTGMPKGVMVSHDAVLKFIGHFTELFQITKEDRIGNQAPFDFDVSVKDIYSSLMTGASLYLIPRDDFRTPARLLDLLCEKKITTLIWAVSALCLISTLKGLEYRTPEFVRKVLFSGEVMPSGQLSAWQKALPQAEFVNLYGPSEITCNCTWFRVDHPVGRGEKLPIGKPFPGRRAFLVDESGKEVAEKGRTGEICVSGESLSEGYYGNPKMTAEKFPVDPEKGRYYKTGDLGYFGEDGNLYFSGRRDFQIKHMGHRIELEEVERAMEQVDGVTRSCCVLDRRKERLVAFYLGEEKTARIRKGMQSLVPRYMIPAKFCQVDGMPLTKNGKIDRTYFLRKVEMQDG